MKKTEEAFTNFIDVAVEELVAAGPFAPGSLTRALAVAQLCGFSDRAITKAMGVTPSRAVCWRSGMEPRFRSSSHQKTAYENVIDLIASLDLPGPTRPQAGVRDAAKDKFEP